MLKKITFSLLLLALAYLARAQDGSGYLSPSEQFKAAEAALVLLKNEGDLLPLRRLDTLRPAYLPQWLEESGPLYQSLDKYMPFVLAAWPADSAAAAALAQQHRLVVIGMNTHSYHGDIAPKLQQLVQGLTQARRVAKVVLVVFGRSELWDHLPLERYADAVLYSPYDDELTQSLAAQVLFGAAGARGRLAQPLAPRLPAGSGLDSPGGLRLRYTPPEALGLQVRLLRDSISSIIQEGIQHRAFPGAQVLVAKDGHVVYHQAFGHHTYDAQRPLREDDVYDFASVTKTTSGLAALMKLHGEGRFDLDAPLSQYLPYFRKTNKADLTFRAMLAHHARLRAWIPFWQGTLKANARNPWEKGWTTDHINNGQFRRRTLRTKPSRRYPFQLSEELWMHKDFKKKIYKSIAQSPLNDKPGYVYSDLFFLILPDVIERIINTDYETFLKTHLYQRLGAHTLTLNPLRYFPRDRMVPTERDTFFRLAQLQGVVHDEAAALLLGISGNAGLFGTANDLAKMVQMYLNLGSYGGEQLLPEATLREFIRCQYCEEGNHRALGFDKPLLTYDPAKSTAAQAVGSDSFGHSGYTGTFYWADPRSGLVYIFLSNRVFPTRNTRVIYERNIRSRIHAAIFQALPPEGASGE